ncbi:ESAT-6-like protein OS=Tsukamurella paurometabola (strain ATCC 8368 / DSM / CCUG 35730 / CIP 100753 / JCM 10117 / KCTC 9821 / NBRC 16120 / NCIMB 702349/ NCTC 13040) OX=521096 GN=Tpau_3369 PE=3 SV=1 [Tsukamurella paurometabola]|uniref:ESAT-6-like protein n=1 Tax=Tsukamurella paurometabola (strain ATCC 8368 / DSM 20162 / CCUG 35730 / CIP 100753 / JCM 10117 / KCTC 9821 / NBRC 16120 / NCIMB 702349 / NCTC 13040) TaxID=521096 RepID=D5UWF4_TSUPD|nr:WXG100 family type VII secretion target [Tsukamurella paurometabola]ADG79953.1 conserved hypothetical protein [Tsukamurella paurometabola DSM 20162]SUP37793.1 Uncharacterized protein conserved in bacteria [Tsukamurella paurometabola]
MSGDFIKYNYDEIRSGLDDINRKYGLLTQQGDSIRQVQNKFDNAWQDEQSATAYQAVQAKWNDSFEEINRLLNSVSMAASNAVDNMQATNQKAANGWQSA